MSPDFCFYVDNISFMTVSYTHPDVYKRQHMSKIQEADLVLVFSCGVGVQTVSEYLEDKMVCAACDTYPVSYTHLG